jgi:hypothetical protein
MTKLKFMEEYIMKKLISGLVGICVASSVIFGSFAYTGGQYQSNLDVIINKIKVIVDGKDINKGDETKVNTILLNGTTYIPLRKVGENMNCSVDYDAATAEATITNKNKKIEGVFICKCIDQLQDKNKTVYKFEIETAKGKKIGSVYGGDFEKGKYYASPFNEPNFVIDGDGKEKEINLVSNGSKKK